jgi:hypothetical protein
MSIQISQLNLINAINEELVKQGVTDLLPRQYNAIISACNDIVDELAVGYKEAKPGMKYRDWYDSDDRGLSSNYLARILVGYADAGVSYHPSDPSDLNRCVKMVESLGVEEELRELMSKDLKKPIATGITLSKQWIVVLSNWDKWKSMFNRTDILYIEMKSAGL